MEIQSPPHPFLFFFLNDQHWLSSDVQCKETEESRGMHLEIKAKVMCSVMLQCLSMLLRETNRVYICLTVSKS